MSYSPPADPTLEPATAIDAKAALDRSRYASNVLRHKAKALRMTFNRKGGWVPVAELLAQLARVELPTTRDQLAMIVANNDKQRFEFSGDGLSIRARQGHTIPVDLGLKNSRPPDELFHGTTRRNLESILKAGLDKRARHDVHLSVDAETAIRVANRRRTEIVLLRVDARRMYAENCKVQVTANGVWLVDGVSPTYLSLVG